jgi:hypothetical protein
MSETGTVHITGVSEKKSLCFRFPGVHPRATCEVSFKKTLRIPDDGESYPLPAGFGDLPLLHIEDFKDKFSSQVIARGGVLMPMYQSEATWLNFSGSYPVAIKVATGKVNAVTGTNWSNSLGSDPQDYMVAPEQEWLDGFCVEKGKVRQFVAEPLNSGKTVESHVTGDAQFGGIQILMMPMKTNEYVKRFRLANEQAEEFVCLPSESIDFFVGPDMGISAGGLIEQEIYEDPYNIGVWDTKAAARCFVHIVNSERYQDITGQPLPHKPITMTQYLEAGIPWFESYKESNALDGGRFGLPGEQTKVEQGQL